MSALLTKYGTWQPSLQHTRGPSVMEALVGSLGGKGGDTRVLLDVGAGIGLFSLAAAARGHHAIAFELSQTSLNSFQQSIAFNGFERQIQLHKVCAVTSSSSGVLTAHAYETHRTYIMMLPCS